MNKPADGDCPDGLKGDQTGEAYNLAVGGRAGILEMAEFTVEQFEDARRENGTCYWLAHEFMTALGYEGWPSFQSVITKAMGSCAALGIDPTEAFIPETIITEGRPQKTYRLNRFACFLVAMNADAKKPEAAKAKAVLAAILDALINEKVNQDALGRIETRTDLSIAEKVMGGVAKDAGLMGEGFAIFKDAGFRGMYNMSLTDLKKHKGVADNSVLYDFMGLEELAGNLFRVTQTARRIKTHDLKGLVPLSQTAKQVGAEVRQMMIKNSGGQKPESLPVEQDISKVKSRLRLQA